MRTRRLLRWYRRLILAGLVATWVVASEVQPDHGPAVTWTHIAALAPVCWLWLTHPKLAVKLLFAALTGSLLAATLATRTRQPSWPRYH